MKLLSASSRSSATCLTLPLFLRFVWVSANNMEAVSWSNDPKTRASKHEAEVWTGAQVRQCLTVVLKCAVIPWAD